MGQRLPRTIAESTNIDTTSCTEHTESVELETISVGIVPFAGTKREGAKKARRHADRSDEISF